MRGAYLLSSLRRFLPNSSRKICPWTFNTLASPCCSPFTSSMSTRMSSYSAVDIQSLPTALSGREELIAPQKMRESYQSGLREVQQEKQSIFIPVKAYFISTGIDLRSLQNEYADNVLEEANLGSEKNCSYMVVFQYGSMVLFNVSDVEVHDYVKILEKHTAGLLPEMRKDEYAVVEKPLLDTWMQGGLDYIMMKKLNIDGIRTIGSVLGQSIALDFYFRQVDGMITEFADINRGMSKTGTFTMKKKKLFQLLGKANCNLADVILKLGLFERSDIVWKNANYALLWEYLRDEYELKIRFDSLDYKLKFVEYNINVLQEILKNRKSDFQETTIILLISVEILISVYSIFQAL